MKRRVVFITGAGAAIPWGGPKTEELNSLIINDTFFKTNTKEKEPLGLFLFNYLSNYYKNNNEINFETFFGFLEMLIDYFISKNSSNTNVLNHSIWPSFVNINEDFEKAILDYAPLNSNLDELGEDEIAYWRIPMDSSNYIPYSKRLIKSKVLREVYKHWIKLITNRIHQYNDNGDSKLHPLNKTFKVFAKSFSMDKNILRLYSTNYDRVIPKILEDEYQVFEGFEYHEDGNSKVDVKGIYNNKEVLTHYNLHGSVNWEKVSGPIESEYQLFKNITPYDPHYDYKQVEVGARAHITNIILGYNKTHKMFLSPFKYFEHALLDDCINSDIIFIIGSSLNDFDLQKTLSAALLSDNKKLVFIGYSETDNIEESRIAIQSIDPSGKYRIYQEDKSNNWFINEKNNCFVYLGSYEKFLLEKAWIDLTFI